MFFNQFITTGKVFPSEIFEHCRSRTLYRPTQPPILSRNEYQPKCGDAPWLASKGGYDSFHLRDARVVGKTV